MIRDALLAGFITIGVLCGFASEGAHQASLHLSKSDFHRYPPRTLFTPDGKLMIAYRIAESKTESSGVRLVTVDGRTGTKIAEHYYSVPASGSTKISDGFLISPNGKSLYYVELTGAPVVLEVNAATLDVISKSTVSLFNAADFRPRVESATDNTLFLSAGSKLPGKAVHIIALDGRDLSKVIADEQVPARPGWDESYKLSIGGDSLWMGAGKYWLKVGIKSGQIETKIEAQNDLHDLAVSSSGLIGLTNLSSAGFLQFFNANGQQVKTLNGPDCGFTSAHLSPDEKYGVAVCEKTGSTEWTFGKTLERKAVIFNLQTMAFVKTFPLPKMGLKTSSGTENVRLWYPQPMVWNSGQLILVDVPDLSGTVTMQELAVP